MSVRSLRRNDALPSARISATQLDTGSRKARVGIERLWGRTTVLLCLKWLFAQERNRDSARMLVGTRDSDSNRASRSTAMVPALLSADRGGVALPLLPRQFWLEAVCSWFVGIAGSLRPPGFYFGSAMRARRTGDFIWLLPSRMLHSPARVASARREFNRIFYVTASQPARSLHFGWKTQRHEAL